MLILGEIFFDKDLSSLSNELKFDLNFDFYMWWFVYFYGVTGFYIIPYDINTSIRRHEIKQN